MEKQPINMKEAEQIASAALQVGSSESFAQSQLSSNDSIKISHYHTSHYSQKSSDESQKKTAKSFPQQSKPERNNKVEKRFIWLETNQLKNSGSKPSKNQRSDQDIQAASILSYFNQKHAKDQQFEDLQAVMKYIQKLKSRSNQNQGIKKYNQVKEKNHQQKQTENYEKQPQDQQRQEKVKQNQVEQDNN